MRETLKNISESDYWVYGLSEDDYDYTVRLAKEFVEAKTTLFKQKSERVRIEQPEEADDILDDVAYYTHTDNEYIWHFCLWRLQAIFEGILVHKLLRDQKAERLLGLKAKLDAIRAAGYPLSDQNYDDLISWGKLRNALSHAPPEQYRPGPLRDADVFEYKALVKRLTKAWLDSDLSAEFRAK